MLQNEEKPQYFYGCAERRKFSVTSVVMLGADKSPGLKFGAAGLCWWLREGTWSILGFGGCHGFPLVSLGCSRCNCQPWIPLSPLSSWSCSVSPELPRAGLAAGWSHPRRGTAETGPNRAIPHLSVPCVELQLGSAAFHRKAKPRCDALWLRVPDECETAALELP